MVVVLPWHDPMRVAEEVSMLDNISGGRLILGLGRGAGKVEFDGFRLSMDESRQRFTESAEMLLGGLETGYCEYDGTFVKQPRAAIRPAPFKSFRGRTYAAAVSPESLPIMAKLGVGILIIPQKPWKEVARELETYRSIYRDVNGVEAPPPVSAGWTFCDESAARAEEMARRFIGGYYQTVLDHYQFQGDHLARTKGYEYYGKMAEKITQYGTDTVVDYFMNLQVWGTPEQCYEKILDIHARTNNSHYVGVFSYAGMPYEDAEANMRLFAREVMPALKKLGVEAPAGEPRAGGLARRPARRRGTPRLMTTPLSVYLPFNIDCLRGAFVPAKRGTKPPIERGNWIIIQDQKLLVVPDGDRFRLPSGERPAKLDGALGEPIWLGTLGGDTECWVASLPARPPSRTNSSARRSCRWQARVCPTICSRSAAWPCRPSGGNRRAASVPAAAAPPSAWPASGASAARSASTSTTLTCTRRSSSSCATATACCSRARPSGRPAATRSSPASSTTASRSRAASRAR